jgi:putative restriction endonuclease
MKSPAAEVAGSYLWSPKRNANGARNPFYESMREVASGDLIFLHGYAHTRFGDRAIVLLGKPKPLEFGNFGQNCEGIGWRVKVHFTELANKVCPEDHIDIWRSLLPDKYSPLASHCKPWRDPTNEERLNGENGLLLRLPRAPFSCRRAPCA